MDVTVTNMTEEELLQLLKEKLSISISTEVDTGYYSNSLKIRIKLSLDGEEISSATDSIDLSELNTKE